MSKKEEKKVTKTKQKTVKKDVNKEGYILSVKKEMDKVRFPTKKEMLKYSAATLAFIIFFMAFFFLTDVIIGAIKMWVA